MRKIVFLSTLALLALGSSQAQLKPNVERSSIKKSAPPPPPAPAPASKTGGTESTPALVYSLTSVRVRIRTGNDNKEFPSKVLTSLRARSAASGQANPFNQSKLDNEMRINSDTEFGMERVTQYQTESRLDAFQSSGLKFRVDYWPNWLTDAWKIEGITLVLEFKDQFGNLHPTLGNKTIVFSNAYGFLNSTYWIMECETDGSFAPLTALIRKSN
jgi:hypothetical protein